MKYHFFIASALAGVLAGPVPATAGVKDACLLLPAATAATIAGTKLTVQSTGEIIPGTSSCVYRSGSAMAMQFSVRTFASGGDAAKWIASRTGKRGVTPDKDTAGGLPALFGRPSRRRRADTAGK